MFILMFRSAVTTRVVNGAWGNKGFFLENGLRERSFGWFY